MVGAIALDGFRGFMTVDAGTGIDVFEAFVGQVLIPNLRDGDIVVMDNLSAHKNGRILRLIERCGARVLFTPPYSPDFNPIEKTWAKLEDVIRRIETLTREAFDKAVAVAMEGITGDDIWGWFKHCGYAVPST